MCHGEPDDNCDTKKTPPKNIKKIGKLIILNFFKSIFVNVIKRVQQERKIVVGRIMSERIRNGVEKYIHQFFQSGISKIITRKNDGKTIQK